MVINVAGVASSRAAAPGAVLAAKDGSGQADGRQFGDMLEKLANASIEPSSARPKAKTDGTKRSSAAVAPDAVSASVADMAALAASVPADAGPAADGPVKAARPRDSQADKPAVATDALPPDSVPPLSMWLGISGAVPLEDATPAGLPAAAGDAQALPAAVAGEVPTPGTATPGLGLKAGIGRVAPTLVRSAAPAGAAAATSPDPTAVATTAPTIAQAAAPTAISVPAALGATPLGEPSTTELPATTTPPTGAAVSGATTHVAGVVPATPEVPGAARATVAPPAPASAQPAVPGQNTPVVASGADPQTPGVVPVPSAPVHADTPVPANGSANAAPKPQAASAAVQEATPTVDATTATPLGGTTPGLGSGGSGDAKRDGRPRGSLAGDAGGTPAVRAAAAPGGFDPQMRLVADVPALDHVVGARQAAASIAGQTSGAALDAQVPHQIVQAIRLQWNQGVGTARVTLQPDYLGDLRIDIRVDRGAVTAVLDASNPAVRQWIESHESTLRQGLAEQGLTLDRLVVRDEDTAPDAGAEQRRQPRDEQPPDPRRRRGAAPTDATFEVVM